MKDAWHFFAMSGVRIQLDDSQEDYDIVSRHVTLELGPILGFGSGGCVYALRDDPTRAVKFTEVYGPRFPRECGVGTAMHDLGVGPRVYQHFTLRARSVYDGRLVPVGVIIMERLSTTLFDAWRRQPRLRAQLWPAICQQIRKVAAAGYYLPDLHQRNVMLHQGRVYLIDFECVEHHTLDTPTIDAAVAAMCHSLQLTYQNPLPPTRVSQRRASRLPIS